MAERKDGVNVICKDECSAMADMTAKVGWNHLESDWRLFVETGIAVGISAGGEIRSTAASAGWNNRLAWIGLVQTDAAWRNKGFAHALLNVILDRFKTCKTIKLDASVMGKPIYEKMGFISESVIRRFSCKMPLPRIAPELEWSVTEEKDLAFLASWEAKFTGTMRTSLWDFYSHNHGDLMITGKKDGKIAAFAGGRRGRMFRQIGPVLAAEEQYAFESVAMASSLISGPVQIDFPAHCTGLEQYLVKNGFQPERDFQRMYKGIPCGDCNYPELYAVFGPEMG